MRRIHFIAYIFFRRHTYKDLNSKAETSWLQKLRYYNQNSSKTRVSKKMLQNWLKSASRMWAKRS